MGMGILAFFSGAGPKYRPTGGNVTPEGRPIVNAEPTDLISSKEAALGRKQFEVTVKVFDLAVPEQLKEYQEVLDRAANRSWLLYKRVPQFVVETGNWKVLTEYAKVSVVLPSQAARRIWGGVSK